MEENREGYKKAKPIIWTVSIVVPVVVALLFRVKLDGYDTSFLPGVYACINGLTALLLIASVIQVQKGNIKVHNRLMNISIVLSLLFLILYIIRHITSDPTAYGGDGFFKYIYYFFLITHIILSVIVIPLVLISYTRAWFGMIDLHKRIVRIAYPIWLYVAITGVIVYLMISPYY